MNLINFGEPVNANASILKVIYTSQSKCNMSKFCIYTISNSEKILLDLIPYTIHIFMNVNSIDQNLIFSDVELNCIEEKPHNCLFHRN